MSDNAFGPIGLEALVDFFQSSACFSLKEIRMHNNGLGPDGAKKLAHAIEKGFDNSGGKMAIKVFICGRNRLEYEGSKAIAHTLKRIGTLEEIQMPQNGIRPNGIENVADAFMNNKNLRIVSMNDNTFRKIGGDQMSKALTQLKKLEYVNFGDCLLRSKGAVQIMRALVDNPNLKELILSFNEINAQAGMEIADLLNRNRKINANMKLIDLNGNKFGDEVKMEIEQRLKAFGDALHTLSEDEGESDEEEEEEEEGLEEEEEEEVEEAEEAEEEEEEEYEEGEEYDEGEEESYEDEDEEDEEAEEQYLTNKFGGFNINQPGNLFANLISEDKKKQQELNEKILAFIKSPNLNSMNEIDLNKFDKRFMESFDSIKLLYLINALSKTLNDSSKDSVFKFTSDLFFLRKFFILNLIFFLRYFGETLF